MGWELEAIQGPPPYEVAISPLQLAIATSARRRADDVSAVGWAEVAPETIPDLLFQGHLPLMRPFDDLDGLTEARPDPKVLAPAVDFLIRSHFTLPRSPSPSNLVTAVKEANERWRGANELFAREAGISLPDVRASVGGLAPPGNHPDSGSHDTGSACRTWRV